MSRRKVRRWVLQSLLWWPTSTWSSLRSWHWRRHRPDPGCGRGMLMTLSASSGRAQPKNSYTISTGSGRPSSSLLRRREDGSLDVSIYRKSTHTDWYLHFESHHPTHVKRGVVRCLHDRAREIISMQDNLQKEVDHPC